MKITVVNQNNKYLKYIIDYPCEELELPNIGDSYTLVYKNIFLNKNKIFSHDDLKEKYSDECKYNIFINNFNRDISKELSSFYTNDKYELVSSYIKTKLNDIYYCCSFNNLSNFVSSYYLTYFENDYIILSSNTDQIKFLSNDKINSYEKSYIDLNYVLKAKYLLKEFEKLNS